MNRSFDISRGANGVDPERGPSRDASSEDRMREERDQRDARDERQQSYGYRDERQQAHPYGGFIGDHDRFVEDDRGPRYWHHEDERHHFQHGIREMQGYPRDAYAERERGRGAYSYEGRHDPHRLPPPEPLPPREVWRGRNEDYDFWGQERHPHHHPAHAQGMHGQHAHGHGGHPSLWERVKGAFTGKGPKNYVRSDERIREDVCEHLSYHPYIDASDIEVIVRDGEVTLSGTVDARMVKRAAEECCDHVRGVKDVHNHLRVRPQGAPAP